MHRLFYRENRRQLRKHDGSLKVWVFRGSLKAVQCVATFLSKAALKVVEKAIKTTLHCDVTVPHWHGKKKKKIVSNK